MRGHGRKVLCQRNTSRIVFLNLQARTTCGVSLSDHKFCQTHVCELDLAELVQQQVLWLQIPVNDVTLMEVLKSVHGASNVKLGVFLTAVEALPVVCGVQLSAKCGFQQEIQRLSSVVAPVQSDDERRIRHHQDRLLSLDNVYPLLKALMA